MKNRFKIWLGIGAYALVNAGAALAVTDAITELPAVSEAETETVMTAQGNIAQGNICRAVAVTGGGEGGGEGGEPTTPAEPITGGEGGEGGEGGAPTSATTSPTVFLPPEQRFRDRQIITDFVDKLIVPNYQFLTQRSGELSSAIASFTQNPTEATLKAARQSWLATRSPWEQSEAFAFGPAASLGLDAELDDWPLNEADVQAVLNSQDALTPDYIGNLQTSQKGFHAIGFLLFGTENNKSLQAFTPRDLAYLGAIAPAFDQTTNELLKSWVTGVDGYPAYRDEFVNAGQGSSSYSTIQAAGAEIAQGILGILDELGNVKIGAALDAQNPFLLEGRFAQNSLQDFQNNLLSAQNAYLGEFPAGNSKGRGLSAFVAAVDPALDAQIRQQMQVAKVALNAIPAPIEQSLCDPKAQPQIGAAQESILDLFTTFEARVLPLVQQ